MKYIAAKSIISELRILNDHHERKNMKPYEEERFRRAKEPSLFGLFFKMFSR